MAQLPQYAGKGFAIDCLSEPMPAPFSEHYTYLQLRSGAVTCPNNCASGSERCYLGGQVLAFILVALHTVQAFLPIIAIAYFCQHYRNQTKAKAFNVILAALGVLSISAVGENAQHIFDNWINLGLLPTFNNAVFYGCLNLGQALLAWGLCGLDLHAAADVAISIATFLYMSYTTWISGNQPAPALGGVPYTYIFTIIALTCTTAGYIIKSFMAFGGVRSAVNWRCALAIIALYTGGIYFSNKIYSTGNQRWHVPDAACFLVGFLVQVYWLATGMATKDRRD